MKRLVYIIILVFLCPSYLMAKKKKPVPGPYAWRNTQPLGDRYSVPMDTLMLNFFNTDLPTSYAVANGYLGNLGSPELSKVFFDRPQTPEFIFLKPYLHWYKTPANFDFYNTRIPFTQVYYLSGGSKANAQGHLGGTFSGNINKRLAVGASFDYLDSKGHYAQQAVRDLDYQVFGSYIGDRYELQVLLNTVNFTNQENGGITDINYILRPEEMPGGQRGIDSKSIPVNLNDAYNRVRAKVYYATQRYNLGYYKVEKKDTSEIKTFIPVSSLIHTIQYTDNMHRFVNKTGTEGEKFFDNTYFDKSATNDFTSWWNLQNTVGISLREGFHKYAKFGLAAYLTHEVRRFTLMPDTIPLGILNPSVQNGAGFTINNSMSNRYFTDNLLWVGGEISKRQGKILTYVATGKIGFLGSVIGDIDIDAQINTRFPVLKDTVQVRAYGFFKNTEPSFYYKRYASNHFIWNNKLGKIRRFRVGGEFSVPRWGTRLNVGVENLQNYVYFDNAGLPRQESAILQVFSATLDQNFKFGIFNLDNQLVYQKSSKSSVIPLPEFSVYSNMYLLFRIAKVLHVQLGVDCRYYTKYYSEAYQPATLSFHVQDKIEVGNYPLMNVYANMKLSKTRFYVMYSHVNKGLFGGNNYFTLPNYPMSPGMFQIGISVDFAN